MLLHFLLLLCKERSLGESRKSDRRYSGFTNNFVHNLKKLYVYFIKIVIIKKQYYTTKYYVNIILLNLVAYNDVIVI